MDEPRQMATKEIEEELIRQEELYSKALREKADVHKLSNIWARIKALQKELQDRNNPPSA